MILASLAISAFVRTIPIIVRLHVPTELELIRSNGLMIPFSFSYCAIMLVRNLLSDFEPALARLKRSKASS